MLYRRVVGQFLFPAALRLTRSRFVQSASAMRRWQYTPIEQQRDLQLARLREIVAHAAAHTRFYAERLREAGLKPDDIRSLDDAARLPITTKDDVQANFPDRIVATALKQPDWQFVGSRGTTNRIVVIHDFARRDLALATNLTALTEDTPYQLTDRAATIPPDDCSTLCGPTGQRENGVFAQLWQSWRGGRLRDAEARSDLRGLVMERWVRRTEVWEPFGPDGTHIPDQRLARYVERLRASHAVMFKALPEYLLGVARWSRDTGGTLPRVPLVKPMGAHLCREAMRRVEQAFGSPVRQDYGSREMGSMAFDCHHRAGLHLLTDQFLIEVVRGGKHVAPGEVGQVLVTDFFNRAMPLLRYRIGDVGRIDFAPCACGRKTPRIVLEGRWEDTLVLPGGSVLTPEAVNNFYYAQPSIDDFQLVETESRWELRAVPRPGTELPQPAALGAEFSALTGDQRPVVVRRAASILPEKSGKFRHVKSRSFADFDAMPTGATPALSS